MLRLWSQVVRPQISWTCIACSSSGTGVLVRRTASATSRRRLKLVDAFTILLAPVLATAFVADAIRKDRRRIEWDRKIAEVEREVQRLHRRESYLLRSWGSAFNARQTAPYHIRSYSTNARSQVVENDTNEEVDTAHWGSVDLEFEQDDDDDNVNEAVRRGTHEPLTLDGPMPPTTEDAGRRIERLVALKLALRMLLHLQIGASPRFKDTSPDYTYEANDQAEDLNRLVDKLKIVRQSLHKLNSAVERQRGSSLPKMPQREQTAIDNKIRHLANDFKVGNLSVSQLVKRIGNSIASSPEPPSLKAYVPLMTTLSRARLDELAYLVMAAMDESRLTLSNHSVISIIWQYGKNRDTNRFDLFLKSVTKADAATKYTESWEWRTINDVQVPCPTSNDARLLQILVYTALKCHQPHRAEAWLSQLRCSDGPARSASHVLRNFMKFYATNRDWRRGRTWLSAALDWSASLRPDAVRDLQRVVFAMLELCVACGKQEAYTCILEAAVHARVGVFAAEADLKFTERSKSILAEWEKLHNAVPISAEDDSASAQRKAKHFCDKAIPNLKSMGLTQRSSGFEWPTPSSTDFKLRYGSLGHLASDDNSITKWRKVCEEQAAELEKVKSQLAELEQFRLKVARLEFRKLDSVAPLKMSPLAESVRGRCKSSPVSHTSVTSAADGLDELSIPASSWEDIVSKSSILSSTSPSQISQEGGKANSDCDPWHTDLEQKSAVVLAPVRDSRPKSEAGSAGAPNGTWHKGTARSEAGGSSSKPDTEFQPDGIKGDGLTEFHPLVTGRETPNQGTDLFQKRNADHSTDRFSGALPLIPDALSLSPFGEVTNEAVAQPSSPLRISSADACQNAVAEQTITTPNPALKGQWTSFLKVPRERKLSARASLRYIHLAKTDPRKTMELPPEKLLRNKETTMRPYIVLRLSQLPPRKAGKSVDGQFRPRKSSTKKAEASAAKMEVSPRYHGRE